MSEVKLKKFLIPYNNDVLKSYEETLTTGLKSGHSIYFEISREDVLNGNNKTFTELGAAAQHRKEWLEYLLLNVNFYFKDTPGVELGEDFNFFDQPEIVKYLHSLLGIPHNLFFLQLANYRMFCLMGDIMVNGEIKTVEDDDGIAHFSLSALQVNRVKSRAIAACLWFIEYCYGTGIQPESFIETVMNDLNYEYDFTELTMKWKAMRDAGVFEMKYVSE